jgi:hypothetical protein
LRVLERLANEGSLIAILGMWTSRSDRSANPMTHAHAYCGGGFLIGNPKTSRRSYKVRRSPLLYYVTDFATFALIKLRHGCLDEGSLLILRGEDD